MYTNAPDAATLTIVSPNIAAIVVLQAKSNALQVTRTLQIMSHNNCLDAFRLSLMRSD
jgi:hypothetical protein